ncbi:SGNH/GDSL hydrolase family protein [Actinocorallia longicatena]|uniref:SGNH/GDSL hydrolase family protein n=1 Tax=Actinocorallia longicatena TaxID=111803 RepID=UPI0031CF19EF
MRRKLSYGLAVLLLAGCSASTAAVETPKKVEPAQAVVRAPVVMMLGDSYTAGIKGVEPEATYAGDLARKLGWQVIIGGYRGTGFLSRGMIGKNFARLFTDQLSWRPAPDMVMIVGGHNDATRRNPMNGLNEAVYQLLNTVKGRWPTTKIVLVGPMWGGDAPQNAFLVRDVMKSVADQMQVPFVDPLAEQWISGDVSRGTGNADLYIRRDETHPNEAGNAYFADKLVAALSRLGLNQPNK